MPGAVGLGTENGHQSLPVIQRTSDENLVELACPANILKAASKAFKVRCGLFLSQFARAKLKTSESCHQFPKQKLFRGKNPEKFLAVESPEARSLTLQYSKKFFGDGLALHRHGFPAPGRCWDIQLGVGRIHGVSFIFF